MRRPVVVHVPVHRQPVLAQQLHAIHPDVVALGFRVVPIVGMNRVDPRQRDEPPAIPLVPFLLADLWVPQPGQLIVDPRRVPHRLEVAIMFPAPQDRQPGQVDLLARLDHLLTHSGRTQPLGPDLQQRRELLGLGNRLTQRSRRLGLDQPTDLLGDGIERPITQRHLHTPV